MWGSSPIAAISELKGKEMDVQYECLNEAPPQGCRDDGDVPHGNGKSINPQVRIRPGNRRCVTAEDAWWLQDLCPRSRSPQISIGRLRYVKMLQSIILL